MLFQSVKPTDGYVSATSLLQTMFGRAFFAFGFKEVVRLGVGLKPSAEQEIGRVDHLGRLEAQHSFGVRTTAWLETNGCRCRWCVFSGEQGLDCSASRTLVLDPTSIARLATVRA